MEGEEGASWWRGRCQSTRRLQIAEKQPPEGGRAEHFWDYDDHGFVPRGAAGAREALSRSRTDHDLDE